VTLAQVPVSRGGYQSDRALMAGFEDPIPLLKRGGLAGGNRLPGPAVILDPVSTTWLVTGWIARLDPVGNLHLERR